MTSFTISATGGKAQTLASGETGTVTATGKISDGGPVIKWDLSGSTGTATLDNSGTITATSGRGIDTTKSASSAQSLSIVNHAGASISAVSDLIRIQSTLSGGSISIDNSGSLAGGTGRGINVQDYAGLASFSVVNAAGATFSSAGDVIRLTSAVAGAAYTGTLVIDNSGTIKSTGTGSNNGQALDLNDVSATSLGQVHIINRGTLDAADADAVRTGDYALVDNYGLIQSHNASAASSGNDGIDLQDNDGVQVNNYQGGSIIGARHGITGEKAFTLNNDGIITGQQGGGLNFDTVGDASVVVTVVNGIHGVITGTATATSDGDGIDVDGLVDIVNRGTIQALGIYADGLNEALAIGGGTVNNSGLILSDQRAITVDDSNLGAAFGALILTNSGTITGSNGEAIAITGDYADSIVNTGTINGSISLGGGNDLLVTSLGTINGAIYGGAGDDRFYGSAGVDHFYGGDGMDFVRAGDGNDEIYGGAGNDTIRGEGGNNILYGDAGNDKVFGGSGTDTLYGGDGNDELDGQEGADRMEGGAGDDRYYVENSGDLVVEGVDGGYDVVTVAVQNYTMTANVEELLVDSSSTTNIYGNAIANKIGGGYGVDTLHGGAGNDLIRGNDGNDILYGDADNDTLFGGAGSDTLYGGDGNDTLYGGAGGDRLVGGAGYDRFVFTALSDFGTGTDIDHIVDLDLSIGERIDLSAIDANIGTAANDAFTWIATAAFSGVAGQLRVTNDGTNATLQGDVDGDGVADFSLVVEGHVGFAAGHFIL